MGIHHKTSPRPELLGFPTAFILQIFKVCTQVLMFLYINFRSKMGSDSDSEASSSQRKGPRTAYDVQRSKLEKLMKNPEKPVNIPVPRKEKDPNKAPEFVYNVMGSSAGAGSGEFHVYRQIRRKEYARQKIMEEKKSKEDLNVEYHAKLEENQREAEERTAKKRAKRQK